MFPIRASVPCGAQSSWGMRSVQTLKRVTVNRTATAIHDTFLMLHEYQSRMSKPVKVRSCTDSLSSSPLIESCLLNAKSLLAYRFCHNVRDRSTADYISLTEPTRPIAVPAHQWCRWESAEIYTVACGIDHAFRHPLDFSQHRET